MSLEQKIANLNPEQRAEIEKVIDSFNLPHVWRGAIVRYRHAWWVVTSHDAQGAWGLSRIRSTQAPSRLPAFIRVSSGDLYGAEIHDISKFFNGPRRDLSKLIGGEGDTSGHELSPGDVVVVAGAVGVVNFLDERDGEPHILSGCGSMYLKPHHKAYVIGNIPLD